MNSFLFNHLKFQIAAATLLIILEIIYFCRPKIRLLSNKIFSVLMVSAGLYLVFDVATVFALVYYDSLPLWFVRFTHQGFIFFLDIALSCIYLYIDILNRGQRRYSRGKLIFICSLYLVSLLSIIFCPIYYYIEDDGIYSYGTMVNFVYAVIIIYSVMTVFQSLKHIGKGEHRKQQIYVLLTMALWMGFGGIQIIMPKILISSVGVASMILLMFLSLENPPEYIDRDTRAFNYYALKKILAEYKDNKREFAIVNIQIDEAPIFGNYLENDAVAELLANVRSYIEHHFKLECYRMSRASLAFVLNPKQLPRLDYYVETLEYRFLQKWKFRSTAININAHANVLCCPKDFPYDGNISELIDFVEDVAAYSKNTGFIRRIDESARRKRERRLSIIKLISDAISNDGIEMFYQPIYSLAEKKFTNAEALVRLKDDKSLGYVSPEEFIPIAEKNGLIMQLSDLIFNQVFKFMSVNKLSDIGLNHVEVNLSGLQSVDSDLPRLMKSLLMEYEIAPEAVNLEITESIAITSGYMLKKNMEELRKFGCSFAMDDFGTGYSNLSRMTKCDFELIKIDKSLLWPCFKDDENDSDAVKNAKILLENMIGMLLKMGRKIVVEGIETKEQFDYLAGLGISYAQGYYFCRPVPEKEFLAFVQEKNG